MVNVLRYNAKNDVKKVKLTEHLAKYIDVMVIYEAIISDKNYEYLEVVKKKVRIFFSLSK